MSFKTCRSCPMVWIMDMKGLRCIFMGCMQNLMLHLCVLKHFPCVCVCVNKGSSYKLIWVIPSSHVWIDDLHHSMWFTYSIKVVDEKSWVLKIVCLMIKWYKLVQMGKQSQKLFNLQSCDIWANDLQNLWSSSTSLRSHYEQCRSST